MTRLFLCASALILFCAHAWGTFDDTSVVGRVGQSALTSGCGDRDLVDSGVMRIAGFDASGPGATNSD